ncbi:ABC transporter substrate-binding protein [Butyricicoccus pullicaecorum]|uniref:ABC transporter substrate-binding protein n=1 Tax=Butyricicoccus pullicaecorum TaxID=501571 RepID=UPI003520D026
MKKRLLALAAFLALTLAGCGQSAQPQQEESSTPPATTEAAETEVTAGYEDGLVTQVASLKGPTSMGLSALMTSENEHYEFNIYAAADEIVPLVVKGEVDIALVPANLAATLYQKTNGAIEVANINTLSVLQVVTPGDVEMSGLTALKGKTIYMTGKGTTPEASLRYLVEKNGMSWDDMTVEFKTEATEVVSALQTDPTAFAVLPEPFATVAIQQLDNRHIALSLGDEWDRVSDNGSQLVTGVTIVRKEFAEAHPAAMLQFAADAAESVAYVNGHPEDAATKIESLDIVKAPIAKLAIPRCNLVCMTGEEMRTALSGYLDALYTFDPQMIGGKLPDDAFYGA